MIRATAILSLLSLLVLVLYLPAAQPPQRFIAQIRLEHAAAADWWGATAANRMLGRAVDLQAALAQAAPLPDLHDAPDASRVDQAVSREMFSVNQRLFNNRYFRSVDALLLLGSYRLASLLHGLPWLLAFTAAALADGWCVRAIRSREFIRHDPEMLALYACLAIVCACATVIGCVLPVTLHPLLLPCAPLVISGLLGLGLGCFHMRA